MLIEVDEERLATLIDRAIAAATTRLAVTKPGDERGAIRGDVEVLTAFRVTCAILRMCDVSGRRRVKLTSRDAAIIAKYGSEVANDDQ